MWPAVPQDDQRLLPRPGHASTSSTPTTRPNQDTLEKLRVHIDAIKPVWRTDVAAEWFDQLDPDVQEADAPLRRGQPPQRRGLDHPDRRPPLQPVPLDRSSRSSRSNDPSGPSSAPISSSPRRSSTSSTTRSLRLFGVHHVALAWMTTDQDWTSEKGSADQQPGQQHRPAARPRARRRPTPRAAAAWRHGHDGRRWHGP